MYILPEHIKAGWNTMPALILPFTAWALNEKAISSRFCKVNMQNPGIKPSGSKHEISNHGLLSSISLTTVIVSTSGCNQHACSCSTDNEIQGQMSPILTKVRRKANI